MSTIIGWAGAEGSYWGDPSCRQRIITVSTTIALEGCGNSVMCGTFPGLGYNHALRWLLIVPNVPYPITGADFCSISTCQQRHDARNSRRSSFTDCDWPCFVVNNIKTPYSEATTQHQDSKLLYTYSSVYLNIRLLFAISAMVTDRSKHIEPLSFSRHRQLAPNPFRSANAEFNHVLALANTQFQQCEAPSSSHGFHAQWRLDTPGDYKALTSHRFR